MALAWRRMVGLSGIILGCTFLGCGGGESKSVSEPVQLSPGMEQMKNEMLKAYQTKSLGKAPGDAKSKP
jgi:hypothetical protein